MDTQQLAYFLKVADTEHMTNAARELHISQPALSRSLRLLEEELGLKLFDRLGRRLALNENGRKLYASATDYFFVLPLSTRKQHQTILSYCKKEGFTPFCRVETSHYQIAFTMVEKGGCVALVPKYAPCSTDCPHIRYLTLKGDGFYRKICLSSNGTISTAGNALSCFLQNRFGNAVQD